MEIAFKSIFCALILLLSWAVPSEHVFANPESEAEILALIRRMGFEKSFDSTAAREDSLVLVGMFLVVSWEGRNPEVEGLKNIHWITDRVIEAMFSQIRKSDAHFYYGSIPEILAYLDRPSHALIAGAISLVTDKALNLEKRIIGMKILKRQLSSGRYLNHFDDVVSAMKSLINEDSPETNAWRETLLRHLNAIEALSSQSRKKSEEAFSRAVRAKDFGKSKELLRTFLTNAGLNSAYDDWLVYFIAGDKDYNFSGQILTGKIVEKQHPYFPRPLQTRLGPSGDGSIINIPLSMNPGGCQGSAEGVCQYRLDPFIAQLFDDELLRATWTAFEVTQDPELRADLSKILLLMLNLSSAQSREWIRSILHPYFVHPQTRDSACAEFLRNLK